LLGIQQDTAVFHEQYGAVEQKTQAGLFIRHDLLTLCQAKKRPFFGKLNHEACLLVW
jgi:hypothetical protein